MRQPWSLRGPGRVERARARRLLPLSVVTTALLVAGRPNPAGATSPTPMPTAPPPPPSAIGSEFVNSIAVSPRYAHTGLVVVSSAQSFCQKDCLHLWVSHDGGSSWARAAAQNWSPGRLTIAADGQGHETLYSGTSSGMLRSDDAGQTWTASGPGGIPTVLPTYASDAGLAVAAAGGPADYVLRQGALSNVTGSNGAGTDMQFMASPSFPDGGTSSPALLVTLDKKTATPLVMQCTAALSCTGGAAVPGPAAGNTMQSAATILIPSSDYAEHGSVFAVTPVGLDKSTDGGHTFLPVNVVDTRGATATTTPMMAIAPGYREAGPDRTAYVAVMQVFQEATPGPGMTMKHPVRTSGGVYRTTDGGSTWSPLSTSGPFSGGAQAVAIAPDGRLFAGYYDGLGHGGLLCSADGQIWHVSCPAVGDRSTGGGRSGSGSVGGAGNSTQPQHDVSVDARPNAASVGGANPLSAVATGSAQGTSNSSSLGRTLGFALLGVALLLAIGGVVQARRRRQQSRG